MVDQVKAWTEKIVIPTYKIGAPQKSPMFLEHRVYQGSSGVVYPHPVIDQIYDEKEDKEYTGLFLENKYLKLLILPELGGRVQMALDKTNGYNFVYYNRVIKPALVGLAGPWISGGIEFNWPQHHRPTTFDPLEWKIQEEAGGSKVVWCAEIEQMFHTKGMHGFRLYPDRAYFEISVQLYNRTAEPQTFLWWANPAVSVHDEYQSVFPQDVHAVMDHGKRNVSSFPIATGTYYKVNYAPGTDISRYKNIPVPTSYMAYHSDYDFMGDYDHRANAGMLHIANHHVVPGKKQWTWGNGDFGQAWDRQLTDQDGPYIELMCGAFTDNQPDFSWMQPGEEKTFTQIFMPYKEIGPACNASEQAVIHLECDERTARFGVYTTSPRVVEVKVDCAGKALYRQTHELSPENPLLETVDLPAGTKAQQVRVSVYAGETLLLDFTPVPDEKPEIPSAATPALPPEKIGSIEELFLNGLHLEQYRHASYAPEPYYLEGLRRDPGDSRCNNAMGLLLYRRGKFAEAEKYFRQAIKRLTLRNPNPYDGEPYYNLGLSLNMQGKMEEAFTAFHKAVWNAAWQDAANYELACIESRKGDLTRALFYVNNCLLRNYSHHKARQLKSALLRRLGRSDEAWSETGIALDLDVMEYGALWERHLLKQEPAFAQIVQKNYEINISLAIDYAHAGLYDEAVTLLQEPAGVFAMAAYTLAWVYSQMKEAGKAQQQYSDAAKRPMGLYFPNRLEDVAIFETAQKYNPKDAGAFYSLGNFWYAHRRYDEAIDCWERSALLDPTFPTVQRNLGLAYFNKRGDSRKALAAYEKAFALDKSNAQLFFELDQLYKRLNWAPEKRLQLLEQHLDLVSERDDLSIEYIALFNRLDHPDEAYTRIMQRNFHPWEGGEGKVTGQYVASLVESARLLIARGQAEEAIKKLKQAQIYPDNLGEGKLYGAQENNIFYFLGCAYEALGNLAEAAACLKRASTGLSEPTSAVYYNDQPPDMIFYQGLALKKLGQAEQANLIFNKLLAYGKEHMQDEIKIDYFAVSLPDLLVFEADLNERNRIHCHYLLGLAYLGLGEMKAARENLDAVLALDINHAGAALHKRFMDD